MKNVIKQLKTLLPCEQFVVTGSYALSKFGLSTKVGDLDLILVNPTEEAINIMKRMSTEFPAKTKFLYESKGYIFMMYDVKVDAFVQNKCVITEVMVDGVLFATVDHIVKAKKSINRMKDWLQLRKLAYSICSTQDFNDFLGKQIMSM